MPLSLLLALSLVFVGSLPLPRPRLLLLHPINSLQVTKAWGAGR